MTVNVQEINRIVRDLRAGLGPLYTEMAKVIVGQKVMVDFAGPALAGAQPVALTVPTDPNLTTLWVAPKSAAGLHGSKTTAIGTVNALSQPKAALPLDASVADGRSFRCRSGHIGGHAAGRGSGDRSVLLPYDGPHRGQHGWHEVRRSYHGSGAEQHGVGAER